MKIKEFVQSLINDGIIPQEPRDYDAQVTRIYIDSLEAENAELRQGKKAAVEDVAERIKTAFYHEFDELIPSTMADKIDEIVKEVLKNDKGN